MNDPAPYSQFSDSTQQLLKKGLVGSLSRNNADVPVKSVKPTISAPPQDSEQEAFSGQGASLNLPQNKKLDLLEEVLAEFPALATAEVESQVNSPNEPQLPTGARKEALDAGGANPVETGAVLQQVEPEKSPEIPPEVDKYLKTVERDQGRQPQEIVLAEATDDLPDQSQYQAQPVIVLPITPEAEKRGARKSSQYSIRWLVEWSRKIIKMFAGKVVYRQAEATPN
ncbi:MAG: hypothetical protein GF381_03625 [Candidatus Pacebacteria bacterium]|nr:hypothetical protein [Candidatus Paceibacterota bacterium]